MAIPALNQDGFLPAGIHECTLAEIESRFGQFQRTDRRCHLFARLKEFVRELQATAFFEAVIVDGSFVSARDTPEDIDLILVLLPSHDFTAGLRPFEYNVLSKSAIRRRFGFDVLIASEGSNELSKYIEFFSRIRDRAGAHKGLLQVLL